MISSKFDMRRSCFPDYTVIKICISKKQQEIHYKNKVFLIKLLKMPARLNRGVLYK